MKFLRLKIIIKKFHLNKNKINNTQKISIIYPNFLILHQTHSHPFLFVFGILSLPLFFSLLLHYFQTLLQFLYFSKFLVISISGAKLKLIKNWNLKTFIDFSFDPHIKRLVFSKYFIFVIGTSEFFITSFQFFKSCYF